MTNTESKRAGTVRGGARLLAAASRMWLVTHCPNAHGDALANASRSDTGAAATLLLEPKGERQAARIAALGAEEQPPQVAIVTAAGETAIKVSGDMKQVSSDFKEVAIQALQTLTIQEKEQLVGGNMEAEIAKMKAFFVFFNLTSRRRQRL